MRKSVRESDPDEERASTDTALMCVVLIRSWRSQIGAADRQTDRQGASATVLFLLRCFANNFGVAMVFSFSGCQAAHTLIRLREHTLIHPLC